MHDEDDPKVQVRACYTPHLTGDLGHRALVARQNARGDPKRMGDPSRYVPADLRKNGMRDDHRDQKMDAKKKDAMKVDDLSHYVPDDPKMDAKKKDAKKMDAKKVGDLSHYVPDDPKMDAMKVDDLSHYVPDDPKKDAKKKDAMKVDDLSHYVPDVLMLNESMVGNPGDHREM